MCDEHESDSAAPHGKVMDRRSVLRMGAAAAGTLIAGAAATSASAQGISSSSTHAGAAPAATVPTGPFQTRAYAVQSKTGKFGPISVKRRGLRDEDILIDILYCGICHSDIHIARSEWAAANYPCVPGHEIVGKVVAVGKSVTKFQIGDIAGVGCIADSCGVCEYCVDDLEQYCTKGWSLVFNAADRISGGYNFGGYSDKIVVSERYGIRIPPGTDLATVAPLLCAGVTTFSPMQHWHVDKNARVGVVGMGGLGHIAVQLAAARGAEVTVFTTTPAKAADAKRLGAKHVVVWENGKALPDNTQKLDFIISTVPQAYSFDPFLAVLKVNGTLVNVGALDQLEGFLGRTIISGRRSLAGSVIGGIAETQQVVDYCTQRGIKPQVLVIPPDQISQAYDSVVDKSVRYRYVIDMKAGQSA